jgi:hypothetical protein
MLRTLLAGTAVCLVLASATHARQDKGVLLEKSDKLTKDDPTYTPDLKNAVDRIKKDKASQSFFKSLEGCPHKVYTVNLKKGEKIVIRQKSTTLDSVVVVEDSKKSILDYNDDDPDTAKTFDSKLVFTAPEDGEYRIIATCLPLEVKTKFGDFTLTVTSSK